MKRSFAKFLPALALLLVACFPAQAQPVGPPFLGCNKTAIANTLGAVTTQSVVGTATTSVHFCGYDVTGTAAGTIQLVVGTGASCTTSTPITAVQNIPVGGILVSRSSNVQFSSLQGQSLCAITTGTTAINYTIYYGQY